MWAVWDTHSDRAINREAINSDPALRVLATVAIAAELSQLFVYVAFVVAGFYSINEPPPYFSTNETLIGSTAEEALVGRVCRYAMTFAAGVMMLKTSVRRWARMSYRQRRITQGRAGRASDVL